MLKSGKCTAATGILHEYKIAREYGMGLAQMLVQEGFYVKIFDSTKGKYKTNFEALKSGVSEANKWGADLFISCHANAFDGEANGTEVCCWFGDEISKKLATDISSAISIVLSTKNRGLKDRLDLYEIKKTKMPAIIIEPIFIDNPGDCLKYTNKDKTELTKAIAQAIKQNLN